MSLKNLTAPVADKNDADASNPPMLTLAMILQNPGEPPAQTRYSDPHQLKELGYNGLVLYETTALSGVGSPDRIDDQEMRRWLEGQFERVREKIIAAHRAGLQVYVYYDVLCLVRGRVERNPQNITCVNRPGVLCPASEVALEQSGQALERMLAYLGDVDGVVIRFGDNDADRLPYLVGNDIYLPSCSRCGGVEPAKRIGDVLAYFYGLVVGRLEKRLIARAWNVRPGGMHDSVDLCKQVVDRLSAQLEDGAADDGRLVLSFKFTETDFWRYQRWNSASLVAGATWPIVYELQCQREFEGKGGIPNWQVPLWRDGAPEVQDDPGVPDNSDAKGGLAQVSGRVKHAGLWAWVRGGGWGGPFVKNEAWIDANVYAVPALAQNPQASCDDLAQRWIQQRLGIDNAAVSQAIREILEHSPQIILQGFYISPYARTKQGPWNPNDEWIMDDLVDAQAVWRMVQGLDDPQLDELVREKEAAAQHITEDRVALQRLVHEENQGVIEPLIHSLMYGESLFAALRDLLAGLVAYHRFRTGGDQAMADQCRQRLFSAQNYWNHHTQRHGTLPGTATSFREANFWELTQRILAELS